MTGRWTLASAAGYSSNFVRDLPTGADPCGENGENHSFAFDALSFNQPIAVARGELVRRTYQSPTGTAGSGAANDPFAAGLWYCDLLPAAT